MIEYTLDSILTEKQIDAISQLLNKKQLGSVNEFLENYLAGYIKKGYFDAIKNPLSGQALVLSKMQRENNMPNTPAYLNLKIPTEPFDFLTAKQLLLGMGRVDEFWSVKNILNYILLELNNPQEFPEISLPLTKAKAERIKQLQHDLKYLKLTKEIQNGHQES